MKPNKPGEWHCRDGRKIVVYDFEGVLKYRDFLHRECNGGFLVESLKGDDWLPATPPAFPVLPPKPAMVYASYSDQESWWVVACINPPSFLPIGSVLGWVRLPHELIVVPHPDNDPEAERLITEVHSGK